MSFFLFGRQSKGRGRVRQSVVLYSNDCKVIAWTDSALVVFDWNTLS